MRTSFQICILSLVALIIGVASPTVNAQCSADLNADHSVTAQDLAIMLAFWGPTTTFPAADINQDQIVNAQDLAMLLAGWGPCAPPVLPWATVIEQDVDPAVVTNSAFRERMIVTGLPWRVRDNSSNIEMLLVPAGTFMMGCSLDDPWCSGDEYPLHQVTLTSAFYLGRYEVTQAQWTATMGSNPSQFQGQSDSPLRPVEQVSWNVIQPFCTQNGLRLPTEAEWEYAYRAGTTSRFHTMPGYPNGFNSVIQLENIAWYSNGPNGTNAVGGKSANALGLHDMSGNVWEWCKDLYGSTYYNSSPPANPTGLNTGSERVLRGGSWNSTSDECRASNRAGDDPASTTFCCGNFYNRGFRVARNP